MRSPLRNRDLSELLCRAAEQSSYTDQQRRALRRAGRRAYRWSDEAAALVDGERSLTELRSIGPWLARVIGDWLADPPPVPDAPAIRSGFLARTEVDGILARTSGAPPVRGDLQTHTLGSDGTASVRAMAESAQERGLDYLAITDHSKGLPIAGGMDEAGLARQGEEIRALCDDLARVRPGFRVLHGGEMNPSPKGSADLETGFLAGFDIVLGAFHSRLRVTDDQTDRYLAALDHPRIHVLAHPRGRIFNFRLGPRAAATSRSRSMAIPTARTSTSSCSGSRARRACASRSVRTRTRRTSSLRSTSASRRRASRRFQRIGSSTA